MLNCIFYLTLQYPNGLFGSDKRILIRNNYYPTPIDIVYTWVNGSDSNLIDQLSYYKANLYLDRNFKSQEKSKKLHCPLELCSYNDHLLLSSSNIHNITQQSFLESVSGALNKLLNINNIRLTFIAKVNPSTNSRRGGLIVQSTISVNSLFQNRSQIDVNLDEFKDINVSIWHLAISVVAKSLGYEVDDHILLFGLPEMRDGNSELSWRRNIIKHFPNGTKLIKASATAFLVALPSDNSAHHIISSFNTSLISHQSRLSSCMIILDIGLVTILSDLSESRFQDNDELRFSLRSLDKFVDWHGHIYIVTNGQVPTWLDEDHPGVTIVDHSQLFPNQSHLPTFNSAAIEAHLHNIPGLADHFLYLNDDVFFGKSVFPEDFYSPTSGYKVYLGWSVPNCVELCPSSWLADGFCDHDCNVVECQWDAGDCIKTHGLPGIANFGQNLNRNMSHNDHYSSMLAGVGHDFCSQGCNTLWLADRYCDQACNVDKCGFDLGDCGDSRISKNLHSARIFQQEGQLVYVANETSAMVINLQEVVGPYDNVTGATISDAKEVLASSYAIKYRIIIIAFRHPSVCKDCYSKHDQLIGINITKSQQNKSYQIPIQFHLVLNTHQSDYLVTSTPQIIQSTNTSPFPHLMMDDKSVHKFELPQNISLEVLSLHDNISIEVLNRERPLEMDHYRLLMQDGLISLAGYHHLVHQLWLSESQHKPQEMRMTAFVDSLQLDKLSWGFLPWEKMGNTFGMTNKQNNNFQSTTSSMRHLLDLYAESLRHSNRILSNMYNVSQRRVPAHGPHFISTAILSEAHIKFQDSWTETSSHRFRSADDIQFAFTYFYFLMGENSTQSITNILHSVDTDLSGTIDSNELRTLAILIHHNTSVSNTFIDQVISEVSNSCGPSDRNMPYHTLPVLNITISHMILCINWTSFYSPITIGKYHFTTHEDTDLSFIMISANRNKVLQELDGLRKHPKKFFCLNDNLPNNNGNASVISIRTDVNNFLTYLFPIASQFEKTNNKSRHINYWKLGLVSQCIMIVLLCIVTLLIVKILVIFRRKCRYLTISSIRRCFLGLRHLDNAFMNI